MTTIRFDRLPTTPLRRWYKLAAALPLAAAVTLGQERPLFRPLARPDAGQLQLEVLGTAGSRYAIEASVNLKDWSPLITGVAEGGTLRYTDSLPANLAARYYRARAVADPPAPNPLTVTPQADTNRTASAEIPATGGTLTLADARGVTYTLSIPTHALLSPETITMTSVTNVVGLPLSGGLKAAVRLEPEGLFLFSPATLRVQFPQAIATNQVISFASEGNGAQFGLVLDQVGAKEITLLIQHFSVWGAGLGTAADAGAQKSRVLDRALEQHEQELAAELAEIRQLRETGASDEEIAQRQRAFAESLEDRMDSFYRDHVRPRLQQGTQDCASGRQALQLALGVERQRQSLGLASDNSDPNWAETVDFMEAITRRCLEEASARCGQHDLTAVRDLMGAVRQATLLGLEQLADEASRRAEKCLRFELDFDSRMIFTDFPATGEHTESYVQARKLPIRLFDVTGSLRGQGPLVYVSHTPFAPDDCQVVGIRLRDSTLTVKLWPGANLAITGEFVASQLRLEVEVGVGEVEAGENDGPRETVTYRCCIDDYCENIPYPESGFWEAQWNIHRDFAPAVFTGWDIVGGSLFARKVVQDTRHFEGVTEEATTFDLWHRPEP